MVTIIPIHRVQPASRRPRRTAAGLCPTCKRNRLTPEERLLYRQCTECAERETDSLWAI